MSELSNSIDNMINLYEDMDLEITILSLLILDYHTSTDGHEVNHKALREIYGYTDSQFTHSYAELEYFGYLILKNDFVSLTSKTKKLFKKVTLRLTNKERKVMESNFEIFWKAYPIKVGKKRAKFEWMKLRPNEKLCKTIINAVATQIKYKAQEERKGKFVPEFQHAERWLKNERYTDECVVGVNFIGSLNNKPQRDER